MPRSTRTSLFCLPTSSGSRPFRARWAACMHDNAVWRRCMAPLHGTVAWHHCMAPLHVLFMQPWQGALLDCTASLSARPSPRLYSMTALTLFANTVGLTTMPCQGRWAAACMASITNTGPLNPPFCFASAITTNTGPLTPFCFASAKIYWFT